MKERTREFIERYRGLIGALYITVGVTIAALILPRAYWRAALGVLVLAFAVFLVWVLTPLPHRSSATQSPRPTIRQHLKRTRAYLQRIMIPVAAAWWLGVVLYETGMSKLQQQAVGVGGAFILLLLGGLYVRNQLRCPGCGTDFSRERSAQLGRLSFDTRGPEDLWDSCPRCGLSFDAPWP